MRTPRWFAPGLAVSIVLTTLVIVLVPSHVFAEAPNRNAATFDRCWRTVRDRFYDPDHNGVDWEAVRHCYRPQALASEPGEELHELLRGMLSELGVSHTSILERETFLTMRAELANRRRMTNGILLEETYPGFFFVRALYEGGPGVNAGLLVGDRVVLVNGVSPDKSHDVVDGGYDPALPGPLLHTLRASQGRELRLLIQRTAETTSRRVVRVRPRRMNAVDAAANSVRVFERDGRSIGYLHIWFCSQGVNQVFERAVRGRLDGCDALVVDLRGRGGRPDVLEALLSHFYPVTDDFGQSAPPFWNKPTAFLIDRRSRSAKEVMAHIIKEDDLGELVGERTEGAVLGANFFPLPDGSYLELPVIDFPVRGVRLEGRGVEAVHRVRMEIPYLSGKDPILEKGLSVLQRLLRAVPASEMSY